MTKVDPYKYRSGYDSLMSELELPGYRQRKCDEGAQLAKEGYVLHVSTTGRWYATHPTKGDVISYERIGYHIHAEMLLGGFLEAGGTCEFHGFDDIMGKVSL